MIEEGEPRLGKNAVELKVQCQECLRIGGVIAEELRHTPATRPSTMRELAEALQMDAAALSRKVTGMAHFRVCQVTAIADVLGLPVSALMDDERAIPPQAALRALRLALLNGSRR